MWRNVIFSSMLLKKSSHICRLYQTPDISVIIYWNVGSVIKDNPQLHCHFFQSFHDLYKVFCLKVCLKIFMKKIYYFFETYLENYQFQSCDISFAPFLFSYSLMIHTYGILWKMTRFALSQRRGIFFSY